MANLGGTSDAAVHIKGLLVEYMHTIDVTRQLLPKVPTPVLARVGWDQVIDMAQMLAGEATVLGKLWNGNVSDVEALAENMQEFFGLLQRLIILAYGAVRGAAGITLSSRMRLSMNKMVDVSVILIKEAVFSYDERGRNEDKISKMIAAVWEAFCILKETPSSNATAIGEALRQATVPIKENLRVMKEVMEQAASTEAKDKVSDELGSSTEQQKEADPPEIDKYNACDEEDSRTEQKEADSCDTPEIIKDEADGDGGSRLKELDDVKDEASVDDDSEQKDMSSDKNKESSCHLPEKFKDGSSLKELKKGSAKDEASVDDGSGVKDEASVDDGSEFKEKDSVDDGSELKDGSVDDDLLNFSPDKMTVEKLTSQTVTDVFRVLIDLGMAMISLSKREEERVVVEFVDSLENFVHTGFSLIKEAVLSKDSEKRDEIPKLKAAHMEYNRASLKSRRTSSNNITELTAEALAQATLSIKETAVGESLCDLKNTPPNNATELAEALAEVKLSMKENTSKMEEQREASGEAGSSTEQQKEGLCDPPKNEASGDLERTSYVSLEDVKDKVSDELGKDVKDEVSDEPGKDVKDGSTDESDSSEWPSDDGDLTPEEVTTARVATDAISAILEMMNLLGPAVVGLQFRERQGTVENFVDSLEKILKLSLTIQLQTAEFRMCVFHPQDISALRYAYGNIWIAMRNISVELHHVAKDLNFPGEFSQAWAGSVEKMRQLDNELDRRENED